jgi:hypothetical protein
LENRKPDNSVMDSHRFDLMGRLMPGLPADAMARIAAEARQVSRAIQEHPPDLPDATSIQYEDFQDVSAFPGAMGRRIGPRKLPSLSEVLLDVLIKDSELDARETLLTLEESYDVLESPPYNFLLHNRV